MGVVKVMLRLAPPTPSSKRAIDIKYRGTWLGLRPDTKVVARIEELLPLPGIEQPPIPL